MKSDKVTPPDSPYSLDPSPPPRVITPRALYRCFLRGYKCA